MSVELTIVVPVFNAADTLADQLEALAATAARHRSELIVVHNRFTDGSRAIAEACRSRYCDIQIVPGGVLTL